MGTFFENKSIGSKSKGAKISDSDFLENLTHYLKINHNSTTYKEGFIFHAYKINKILYYLVTKDEMDEYDFPREIIADKVVFYGKTIYLITANEADPIINEYEQKNEMILW